MRDVVAKRRDGSEFHVQIGVRLVETSTEKFFVAYCHDLTLHRTQRQSIQVQQQSIEIQKTTIQEKDDINKSILDSSFDAIIVCNDNGIIQQINQTTLDEFGYSDMSDLVGENLSLLVGGNHADRHDMYMERFRNSGRTSIHLGKNREVCARRKDGSQFPCRIGIKKVPNTSLLVGFVHDITHEKKAIALSIEKRAAEELLHNMLPEPIAIRLKKDPNHIADHFTRATILFADIVGFTSMSNKLKPIEVVTFLNDIFSRFDARLDRYGLNKVKTIGDCYMVTSVPSSREPNKACTAVCYFAMDMIREIEDYNVKNPEQPLNMRIGKFCRSSQRHPSILVPRLTNQLVHNKRGKFGARCGWCSRHEALSVRYLGRCREHCKSYGKYWGCRESSCDEKCD
jgi:PAS domain S-box-containing protein